MKGEIVYPVVYSETKVVEMSEEKFEEIGNMNLEDKAAYIMELDKGENLTGINLISQAYDCDMAWIREVK